MDYAKESLRLHGEWKGKIEMVTRVPVKTKDDLSLAYTPGVAQPCLEIQKDINKSYELTRRWNMAAVITDGSAVLGLGDIGPEAGMPVMEGKCVLFKAFGDVDAFPLCVKTKDVDEFVETVYNISGSFGGINLEDIAAPRCFEIERKLKEKCDIPIFHDDQHGTAVITLAGLTNALKVVGKKKEDVKIVTSGAGAAAIAITKLLLSAGFRDITMCDRKGAIYQGREGLNWIKTEMAEVTNLSQQGGHARRYAGGRGCVHRRERAEYRHDRDGQDDEQGRDHLRLREPDAGDLPRRRQRRAAQAVISTGRSDYPEPDQQRARVPRHFPRCVRCAGERHQRGDEGRGGGSAGETYVGRRSLRGLYHPRGVRSARRPRGSQGGRRSRTQERRGKDLSPTGGTKRPCRRPRRRQTGMEHLTERNAE